MNLGLIEKLVNTLVGRCQISSAPALSAKVSALGDISSLGLLICAILMTHETTGLQRSDHRGITSQKGVTKEAINDFQNLINARAPLNLNKPIGASSTSIHNHELDKIISGNIPQAASVKHAFRNTRSKFVKRRILACCFGSVSGSRSKGVSSHAATTADRGVAMDHQASAISNLNDVGGYSSESRGESAAMTMERQVSGDASGKRSHVNDGLEEPSGSEDAVDWNRADSFTFPRQMLEESQDTKAVSGTLEHWRESNEKAKKAWATQKWT